MSWTDIGANVGDLIRQSTRRVVQAAEHVRINPNKVKELAQRIASELKQSPTWDKSRHFLGDGEQAAQWLFVLDTLNFSFWPDEESQRWKIDWQGETVKGYWALACGLNLAMQRNVPITAAAFLEQIKLDDLKAILGGSGTVPMIDDRVKVLNEIGAILKQRYDGAFSNLIEEACGSVEELVRQVVNNFPCYRDVAPYKNDTVYLFKRAQILCSDLWGAFEGKELGAFFDISRLTAFADYKLPQLLRALGVLEYAPELAAKVDSYELLLPSSIEEVEIRSATVCAVEDLVDSIAATGIELCAMSIDWWLWDISHESSYEKLPHHRTRTIFY